MDYNLNRFVHAQAHSYENALNEIRNGHKRSHWMWYVFPQLRGLGQSANAQFFGISCAEEARAYLSHPVLGARLVEISEALMALEDRDACRIFGYPDVQKLRSSMTLFAAVSEAPNVFQRVLDAYYGGRSDEMTLKLLKQNV